MITAIARAVVIASSVFGVASCAASIAQVDLIGLDAAALSTLLKAEPALERMEGDHALRRYDFSTCALLVTFDARADRATAVAATDAAGPVDPVGCLERSL